MNIAKDLAVVASSLRCPEVKETQTIRTFGYLLVQFNKLETEVAYSILLEKMPEYIQAWKDGLGHNLSSVVWKRGRWHLLAECKRLKALEKYEDGTFSLDAQKDEESNLHETIEGKSETIDWKDAFDFLLGNAGFTEREKQVVLGLKEGKTLEQIGNEFGVSRQTISLSKIAIEKKSNRIRNKVLGNRD